MTAHHGGHRAIGPAARIALAALLSTFVGSAWLTGTASAAAPRATVGSLVRLPADARVLGALRPSSTLRLTVSLRPRDAAALQRYATAVSTPGNPDYGRFLGVGQFARRFGAPGAHVAAVERALRADGLRIGALDRNDLTLAVSGPTAAVEHAFGVSLFAVHADGVDGYANGSAATLPASIAHDVQAVNGFDDVDLDDGVEPERATASTREHALAAARARPHVPTNGGPQPCAQALALQQSDPVQGYTADTLATAYGFPSLYGAGDLGQGQTIGLIEIQPFTLSDIATYNACYGVSPTINTVNVAGGPTPSAVDDESALDIEILAGMAPRATIDVYQGQPALSAGPGIWSAAISANQAKVISASLGKCEADDPPSVTSVENTLFQEAAAQGQTVFVSSGDSGSAACAQGGTGENQLAVSDPASQPFATGVGGTTLFTITPQGAAYYSPGAAPAQSVWNDGGGPAAPSGTGGGVSSLSAMPSYQSTAPLALGVQSASSSAAPCGGTSLCREVPDVSADGDPGTGYVVFEVPGDNQAAQWTSVGGTSAASPLWAAWTALVNDLPACRGLTLGFANPSLYAIAGSAYNANFGSVPNASPFTGAADNDAVATNNGLYPVSSEYDMTTGLGSMTPGLASSLCAARAPVYTVSVANPGAQVTTVGRPVSLQIGATDSGGAALAYSATGLPAGLSISAGGLITGTPTTLQATTVTVGAADGAANSGSAQFTWTVAAPPAPPRPKPRRAHVSRVKVSGLTTRRPKLSFTLAAATGALRSFTVTPPKHLAFAAVARAITVSASRKTKATIKVRHGVLTVTLRKTVAKVKVTIRYPALTITRAEATKIERRKVRSLTFAFTATNGSHRTSRASAKLAKLRS